MNEAINMKSINSHTDLLTEPKTGLQARIIDLSKPYPDITYLFERNGQCCFSLGDIQAVKGKAKSGKTTFLIGLFATLITGENMGFKAIESGRISMYVDTEQNPINTAKMVRKVHSICSLPKNENNERFIAINLRGDNPAERRKFIHEAVEKYKPSFVIVDGLKDIIEGGDINTPKESSEAVQFLMTLTKAFNVAILTVLHENKSDTNMRGHVGTELLNKCSEVWQIKKVENVFEAEQIENRNEASNMVNFSFEFNDDHIPVLVEIEPKQSPQEKTRQKKVESFYFCLPPGMRRTHGELSIEYCQAYGCSEKTAERDIANFLRNGYLIKDEVTKEYRFNGEKNNNFSP